MWENLSAEQFSEFKKMVEDNHTVMGSVLCTLSVIMTVWNDKFPFDNMAGPNRRADFNHGGNAPGAIDLIAFD